MKRCFRILKGIAAVSAACFCFCACGFFQPRLPRGCSIDGIDVSEMTIAHAKEKVEAALRQDLSRRSLVVRADGREYVCRAPNLYYETDADAVLQCAQRGKGGAYSLKKSLKLHDLDETVRKICASAYQQSRNAQVCFDPLSDDPLSVSEGENGRYIDGEALCREIRETLAKGGGAAEVPVIEEAPPVTAEKLSLLTKKISSFTTRYNASAVNRAANVALAAERVCREIASGEEFSFNAAAGARTAENGYRAAPVIWNGEYISGVGGGVCQVSTTVYNAALLAGMRITEFHPHSLAVGYVEPSFDAMVNGSGCDLRFVNESGERVWLVVRTGNGTLTAEFYGMEGGVRYSRESVVVGSVAPPDPIVRTGSQSRTLRASKNGVRSVGWLIEKSAAGTRRIRLRSDFYAPVRGIIERAADE